MTTDGAFLDASWSTVNHTVCAIETHDDGKTLCELTCRWTYSVDQFGTPEEMEYHFDGSWGGNDRTNGSDTLIRRCLPAVGCYHVQ